MEISFNADTTTQDVVIHFSDNIKGKIILTTGTSTGGIGANFVRAIANAEPKMLILANRDPNKSEDVIKAIGEAKPEVEIRTLQLNLGSLSDVRRSAETFMSWDVVPHVDVLVNNAGIMATDYRVTMDGFESQIATNHYGHFLFTNLIMEKLLASGAPRLVNVSSDGHRLSPIRWADPNFAEGDTYNRWAAYGQSKTANILTAIAFAKRFSDRGLLALSLNPGTVRGTNLGAHVDWENQFPELQALDKSLGNMEGWRADFKWKTAEQGAATHVYAAFAPFAEAENGAYLQDCNIADPWTETVKPWATSTVEAERLWKLSEEVVGQVFA